MGENASAGTFRGKGEIVWKGKKHLEGSDDEYQYGIKLLEVLDEGYKLELLVRGHHEKEGD